MNSGAHLEPGQSEKGDAVNQPLESTAVPPADAQGASASRQTISPHSIFDRPWLKSALFCLLLALTVLILYWPAGRYDFVEFDDVDYILDNPHVRTGVTWENIRWAFAARYAMNWHPLTWISHMVDTQCFGLSPAGPHLENLFWHAANALLLFALWERTTRAFWPSAFVAAIFALHPLRVESVAWIAERKDLLSTFFALLAMLAYARHAQARSAGGPGRTTPAQPNPGSAPPPPSCRPQSPAPEATWGWYGLALLFLALGLLSKPMVVTLPLVLLLLDYWPLGRFRLDRLANLPRSLVPLIAEKIPFFVLTAIACVLTFLAQKEGGAVQTLQRFSLDERIENTFVSYARYLGKAFWPHPLSAQYPHPGHWPGGSVLAALALLALLSCAAWRWRRRFPFLLMGWCWFLITLIPVIGLVQVCEQSMADRYSYLTQTGIFVALTWSVSAGYARGWFPRPLLIALGTLALAACTWLTHLQLPNWQDTATLYRHALEATGDNPIIVRGIAYHYYDLGNIARQHGRMQDAIGFYRKAIEINSQIHHFHNNLGLALQAQGHLREAIDEYTAALNLEPNDANAHSNLGVALATVGRLDEATRQLLEAVRLAPDNAESQNNLGALYLRQGRPQEAVVHYLQAARLRPAIPAIQDNLGDALLRVGQTNEAINCYRKALELDPADAKAAQRLRYLDTPPHS